MVKYNTNVDISKLPLVDQYKMEMALIKKWFDTEYTEKEQKFNRFIALERLCDDGKDPSNALNDLYILAEEKRARYNALEQSLQQAEGGDNL